MTNGCPRCGSPLVALQAGAFTLDACRACAGVFAPTAAAAHLCQKLDEQMAAAVTQISAASADMSAMPDAGPQLPCPICNAPMERVVASETSLDTCTMHGTWFDAWELERVMRARAAGSAEKPVMQSEPGPAAAYSSGAAANVASGMSEGAGMAAVEIVGDVVASGAAELAVEGLFAIIIAIFD